MAANRFCGRSGEFIEENGKCDCSVTDFPFTREPALFRFSLACEAELIVDLTLH
ncbi:hypothetical protein KFK09_009163 [Dendrobium nobile]|uniref:Uncharacterized protein n=1 Tax=Dendrobium nobile TaxID=94219 RepID=A0A8T3BPZ2_DENNO|nr:hypothetical protein KFK09_009163 [Dendrobium nobile]